MTIQPGYVFTHNIWPSSTQILQAFGSSPGGGSVYPYGKSPVEKPSKNKNKLYNIPLLELLSTQLSGKKQLGEIGLEIECEGMNLFDAPISYWKTSSDGSLRAHGEHPPIEYILRKPLSRSDVPKSLTYLSRKLKEVGSKVDDSTRTSVHVHLNCQDLNLKQVIQIVCLHTIFEEILVNFAGPDRVGNFFCLRAKDAEHFIQLLETAIQTNDYKEVFNEKLRYTACNVASLYKFGSLEFRAMRGTVDQDTIQTWVDILCHLRDQAVKFKNPAEIVNRFTDLGPRDFFHSIFPPGSVAHSIISPYPDRDKLLWDGMRLMRDVAMATRWEEFDPDLVEKKDPLEKQSEENESPNLVHSNAQILAYLGGSGAQAYSVLLPDGTYWHINYGLTMVSYDHFGSTWSLGGRTAHQVNANGQYMNHTRTLADNEVL